LREGEEYTVAWTNGDGAPHDFVFRDADDERVTGTDIVDEQGETTRLTVTASREMTTYICTLHPGTMVGDVEIV
jgi:plastocyanin